MSSNIVGWDIGGAHLKAALLNQAGQVVQVYQQPCPLWKGLLQLEIAMQSIVALLPKTTATHVITMTGELVDFFSSRDQGVVHIIAAMQGYLGKAEILLYAGNSGLISIADVKPEHYAAIASANWLASASFVAQKMGTALFVDIGSTTTDILWCDQHTVQAVGFTDYQRLQSQELIYTGIVRTAVMAVSQNVFFQGAAVGLMAEYFATMADVYRLTGDLNEAYDQTESADGMEKTVQASARRLSRMIGYEFNEADLSLWQQLAMQLKYQQKQQIQHACLRQLSRSTEVKPCLIGAGIGRFLVKHIAFDLGHSYQEFSDFFIPVDSVMSVADCAPAVAVAYLGREFY